jgi:hypothetical protein
MRLPLALAGVLAYQEETLVLVGKAVWLLRLTEYLPLAGEVAGLELVKARLVWQVALEVLEVEAGAGVAALVALEGRVIRPLRLRHKGILAVPVVAAVKQAAAVEQVVPGILA